MPDSTVIAFLGFGEAAQAFLKGFRTREEFNARVIAYDIKTESADGAVREGKCADYGVHRVLGAVSAPAAVAEADLVFSVVTADQAHEAALAALPGLKRGALFFDCDSCAPQTKVRSAAAVDAAGAKYVDVAVMAPVHPRLHRTPCLISGPHAGEGAGAMRALDMSVEIHEGPIGAASAIKMVRSVMVKGLEALVCECVLAGETAGVIDVVLASLEDTFPGFDWKKRSAYMLERVMTHGVRRAAEMREVALTVDLLGFDGAMSRACIEWQQKVGDLKLDAKAIGANDYHALARALMQKLGAA
jgi:3-hydroxyisobutyrate dehydrogenase-like beta-hydroxyacid dehydrogenase